MRHLRAVIVRGAPLAAAAAALLSCAVPRDHFYALEVLPGGPPRARAARLSTHVLLNVSVPLLVDRPEMVVRTDGEQVLILEHERWAAPLSDLLAETLARDLERRRADVFVAGPRFDQPGARPVRISVEVVRMTARRGGRAMLEAHWRIVDPASKSDVIGAETLTAPLGGEEYAGIAAAYSACLASLADRLAQTLP